MSPQVQRKFLHPHRAATIGFAIVLLLGLALLHLNTPLAKTLRFASYDWSYYLPFTGLGSAASDNLFLIYLDEESHHQFKQPLNKPWDRALHAALLDRLTRDGAQAVVFDIIFSDPGPNPDADQALTEAIRHNGRVVLTADWRAERLELSTVSRQTTPPFAPFAQAAAKVGLAQLMPDDDFVVREHWHGPAGEPYASLTWAAAQLVGAGVTRRPNARFEERWLNYYQGPSQIPFVSYCLATNQAPGFYSNKIVVVGARPMTGFFGERRDELRSPDTTWYSEPVFIPAVQIHATVLQNLLREDWLKRLPPVAEWLLMVLGAAAFGYRLTAFRPTEAALRTVVGAITVVVLSAVMLALSRNWFPWMIIVAIQIPAGLLWTMVYQSIDWYVVRRFLEAEGRQAELRIREQAALLDKAQDAIMVHDLEGRATYWNPSAARLYGWPAAEALQQDMATRLAGQDPASLEEPRQAVLHHGEWVGELRQTTKTGGEVTVESRWTRVCDDAGRPKSILSINTDITEKKGLQSQLLRTQRMESIGALAGGLAHDLNNLLTPIMMATQLMQMRPRDEKDTKLLKNIAVSAQLGADMVKQVLSFARGQEGAKVLLQLNHIVLEIQKFMEETLPRNIVLQIRVDADLTPIRGDPTQLHQILLNLCVNARDAMPEGGTLWIDVANVTLDAKAASQILGAKAGPYVSLRVRDTGTGIPPEIIDRIFEPFFTTKAVGQGTGLGLSTVMNIIQKHGALLDLQSKPGQGTTFTILFPPAALVTAKTPAAALPPHPPQPAVAPFWWWTTNRSSAKCSKPSSPTMTTRS